MDPVTERKNELEQGLNELQQQVDERVNAPAPPLTPPVDPNAPPPMSIVTSSDVQPPEQQPEEAPEQNDHPTWGEVSSKPGFQELSPEKQLVAFSRWHDDTYNLLSKTPEWKTGQKDFNQNAANTESALSAAAGGLTPDQARVKIATDAINGSTGQARRDVLKQLGPDISKAYYAHITDENPQGNDWDFGQGASTDFIKAALSTVDQTAIGAAKGAVRFIAPPIEMPKGHEHDIGAGLIQSANEKLNNFNEFMNNWREEVPKGVGVKEGTTATQLGEMAGGLAPYMAALPAAVVAHMGQSYGDNFDKTSSKTSATTAAAMAGITDILFMQLGEFTNGFTKGIEADIPRIAANLSSNVGANIGVGQLSKAADAALAAKPGDRWNAFRTALSDVHMTDAGAAIGFAALMTKHAETARAAKSAAQIADEGNKAADKAQQNAAPKVAAAVKDVTQQQAADIQQKGQQAGNEAAGEVVQKNAEVPLKQAEPAAKEGEQEPVTFTKGVDADGEVKMEVNIPADATIEQLQAARKEADSVAVPGGADHNTLVQQIDEAIAEKQKEFAPAEEGKPTPQEPANAPAAVSPEERAQRVKDNEAHLAMRAKQERPITTRAAAEADEAIKSGRLKDISYDGRGMVGEQFTELNPDVESHGATFEVPTHAGIEDIEAKRQEVQDRFEGKPTPEEPTASPIEKEYTPSKDEVRAVNQEAYAKAQAVRRAAGSPKDFDTTGEYNKQRAQLMAELKKNGPTKPVEGEKLTRAQRSLQNKEANRKRIADAAAARKAARAEAGQVATPDTLKQVEADTLKRGTLPSLAEMKEAHPQIDITQAADLRRDLQKKLAKQYPPEELPKGTTETSIKHPYTQEDLPMVEEKGEDGVTRTRPKFTNDPEITAQQKDVGLFSDAEGNRLYIPDELVDDDKVNPAILDHAGYDKPKEQYYVRGVDTSLGHVDVTHEEALGMQGSKAKELKTSYTQLRQERDAFGKAHKQISAGDKLEAIADQVDRAAQDRGYADDAIKHGDADAPAPDAPAESQPTEVAASRAAVDPLVRLAQMAEADRMGLIQHEGGPAPDASNVLDSIIADPNTPNWMRLVANLVRRTGHNLGKIKIEIVNDPGETWAGRWYDGSNTMKFNITGGRHLGGLRTTFMHEMFHAILDPKMHEDAVRNPVEQKAYDALKELHEKVSREIFKRENGGKEPTDKELQKFQAAQADRGNSNTSGRDYYGLLNPREFITETLTNPEFQSILTSIEHDMPAADRAQFKGIVNYIKDNVKRLFAGSNITSTSALDHALGNMFDLLQEGRTEASKGYVERVADWRARQRNADIARQGGEVRDNQKLTRAERSLINKAAYRAAQEAAKKDSSIDVMKEYEKQRAQMVDAYVRGNEPAQTFTAEGRAKMAEAAQRATERAKQGEQVKEETGLTPDELDAEISGAAEGEPPTSDLPAVTDRPSGEGWVRPDGKFQPNEERTGASRVTGVEVPLFGGHEGTAWKMIEADPELADKFEKFTKDKGYEHVSEVPNLDIQQFMQDNGYLRVVSDGRNTFFTGDPRKNPQGVNLLMNHAIESERSLVHDQEISGPNSQRSLYEPPTAPRGEPVPEEPANSPAAAEPEAEKEETPGKLKIINRANGERRISIEGVPNEKQVKATMKLIDEDKTAPEAVKNALKEQLAIAAKRQDPTLVEQKKIAGLRVKDTGVDTIVAGGDAAQNIPRIMGEQKANKIAQLFGSVKKVTKEQALDRAAMPFVVEAGGDINELHRDLDRVANSKDLGKAWSIKHPFTKGRESLAKTYTRVIEHAIENFEKLNKLKEGYQGVMKDQLLRERAYGIETPELKDYVTRLLDLPENDNAVIGVSNGQGGTKYFTKARSFEKLSDAIEAGYIPKTTDIVDLTGRRVEASERLIQQKILHESLKSVLASDGKPIVSTTEPRETLYQGTENVVPRGYQSVTVPGGGSLVVHNDYAPLFHALYGARGNNVLAKWAGFMKRNTLVLDTYHVGRIMMKEAAFAKGAQRVGYGKGLSILEYEKGDLKKALQLGDINQAQYDFATKHYEDAHALIRSGLNVSKIADNLNAELTHALPFLKNFNPWVFSKLSRGAMMQTALENLTRNQARFGGEMSREQVLQRTAKEMNEVFGNLQMQSVIKDPKYQNVVRSLLLAPQWAESQLKSELRGYGQLARAPLDLLQGKARLGVVAQGQLTAALGLFAAMQVASMLLNGHSTFQNKKGDWLSLHIPGGRAGFEFNPFEISGEYAHMAYRYYSQHMAPADIAQRIAFNKLNPLPHGVLNYVLNRDYAGKRYADEHDRRMALAESVLPLPPLANPLIERDPRSITGFRASRAPGALEKTLLQSAGIKVSASLTPRGEVFNLAHRFRDDKSYGDNSPPVYRELRSALDNGDSRSVESELRLLINRGATEDQIKHAVGITHGGIQPEKFTGKAEREKLFVHSLTPEQKEIYKQAQADHKTNANRLRAALSQLKLQDTEVSKQLHQNAKKPKASDFEQ